MASPLPDLHYTGRPQSYSMISPNDPTANACKVVEFHGEKIAAFHIHVSSTLDRSLSRSDLLTRQFPQGKTMLCLPQAFELFLKNLVGGLHTVYTKCKRLELTPMICNVEQVSKREWEKKKRGKIEKKIKESEKKVCNCRCECFEALAQSSRE